MKRRNKVVFWGICISIILLTGCWDRVEIEERGFVMGIGIDTGEKEGEMLITYQIALPAAMFGEGEADKKVWNVSTTSPTIIRAKKNIKTRVDKVLNVEHTRVIIISKELAEQGIAAHMDYFLRDVDMRRRTDIIISEGPIKEIFAITPPTARSTSDYLADILLLNEQHVHRISSDVDLLELAKNLRRGSDFILVKAKAGEKDIELTGAAVFRKDTYVGHLSPDEVKATKWLIDDISRGTIILQDVDGLPGHMVFEISEGRSKVTPRIQGERVDFDVQIRIEGDVAEMQHLNFENILTQYFIENLERAIEQLIKRQCHEILKKAQEKFEADFMDFGGLVRQYNARWFKAHEQQWREIFKESELNVSVDANIRRIGLVQ